MAVYLVTGRDLNGRYLYNESKPLFSWTTKKKEESKTLEGLIAGRTYLLMEEKAPNGYDLMEPVAFTISMDGRRITELDNKKAVITFEQHPVETLTIHGRYGIKVEMSVTDSQDRKSQTGHLEALSFSLLSQKESAKGNLYDHRNHDLQRRRQRGDQMCDKTFILESWNMSDFRPKHRPCDIRTGQRRWKFCHSIYTHRRFQLSDCK